MTSATAAAKDQIKELILSALGRAIADGVLPEEPIPAFTVEQPADSAHGDLACNCALVSAKAFRKSPKMIAETICERIHTEGTYFDRAEVAGPGFINFYAAPAYYTAILGDIISRRSDYGKSDHGEGRRVLLEYVSANPTGPMHIGNARGGATGDCLASVMQAAGYYVEREFYINDAGNQIDKFALSLDIRYQQHIMGENYIELPEDSYHGADITERAEEFFEHFGDGMMQAPEAVRRQALVEYALPLNIAKMKTDLAKYRIEFDTWFHESELHKNGEIKRIVSEMTERGLTYVKDGAVWYKATGHGGEKDEVLIRSNGNPTYFAADIAYHYNKFAVRGFDICIDVWGADHHGHIARMRGALDAIGLDGNKLEIVLIQLVKMVSDGRPVKLSKRSGKAIQLADLLDEISCDAARFMFNMRESTVPMELDLDLAVKQDSQNPVYYVQYAYARICSIFKKFEENGDSYSPAEEKTLALLNAPEELELIRALGDYTDEIIKCAKTREPSGITRYVLELATKFHKFYNACRCISDDRELTAARLTLCDCARQVLGNALGLLKVTAPEHMEQLSELFETREDGAEAQDGE